MPTLFAIVILFFLPFLASAQTLLEPLPFLSVAIDTPEDYLAGLALLIIAIAGVLAVVRMVVCGFQAVSSLNPSAKAAASQCVFMAIGGLLLALSAWVILNEVNPAVLSLTRIGGEQALPVPEGPLTPVPRECPTRDLCGLDEYAPCVFSSCQEYQPLADVYQTIADPALLRSVMAVSSFCTVAHRTVRNNVEYCGLMQLSPLTANAFRSSCGISVNDRIDCEWLQEELNVEAQICLAARYLEALEDTCGNDPRSLIAGYHGGPNACAPSTNCSEASCASGGMDAWECAFANPDHTRCSIEYSTTQDFVRRVRQCVAFPNGRITPTTPSTPETTPPFVRVVEPVHENIMWGIVAMSAQAFDPSGIASVQFNLDGVPVGEEDSEEPYSVHWDTREIEDGWHTVTAIATDTFGNTAESVPIRVYIENTTRVFDDYPDQVPIVIDPPGGGEGGGGRGDVPPATPPPVQGDISGIPVIPGARGYGITTRAGRGGRVYRVTNLNNSGSGSLRACTDASGPRVCIFEVSGTIHLGGSGRHLVIRNSNLTIAGQTAPSPGITLHGTLWVAASDVLVQHIRVRNDNIGCDSSNCSNRDSVTIGTLGGPSVRNIILDHLSISWSVDENFSSWSDRNDISDFMLMNSFITEALASGHPEGPHSMGPLIGRHSTRAGVLNNLMAHNNGRNPLIRDSWGEAIVVNNLIYNPGDGAITIGGPDPVKRGSIVGNVLIPGTNTGGHGDDIWFHSRPGVNVPMGSQFYIADNRFPGVTSDPWSIVSNSGSPTNAQLRVSSPPSWPAGLVVRPSSEVESSVLRNSGARPADRDGTDIRVVNSVRNRGGRIIRSLSEVGGFPNLAQNRRALTLPPDPDGDSDGDGYTNLEEWLHSFYAEVE